MNYDDHATIECLQCGSEFDGDPESQIELFKLHDCQTARRMRRQEIAASMRRHPTGRSMPKQKSNAATMMVAIGVIAFLAIANWIVETIADNGFVVALLLIAIFTSLIVVIAHNVAKLLGE
jgi:hypothetical protein